MVCWQRIARQADVRMVEYVVGRYSTLVVDSCKMVTTVEEHKSRFRNAEERMMFITLILCLVYSKLPVCLELVAIQRFTTSIKHAR